MMMNDREPIDTPSNQRPLLLCEGVCQTDAHVPHTYRSREVRKGADTIDITVDYIFSCDVCGVSRVYGASGAVSGNI